MPGSSVRFRFPLHVASVLLLSALAVAACGRREPERPSIVVILVDDLGAFDLPSYGHPYHRAPNLDRLAREGLRFTQAYAASPVCAPTRAAFLTGKSPARLHLTHALPPQPAPLAPRPADSGGPAVQKLAEPQSATWLDSGEVTIAERLRARGYRTALVGKWHLGRDGSGPASQGFDVAIGGEEEAAPRSFFSPHGLSLLPDGPPGEDLTARLTDEAIAFLDSSVGEGELPGVDQAARPFFLVVSHFAVHTPIEARAEAIEAWRQRLSGVEGAAAPEGSLRPAYAAMIESVDHSVGRILAKLDQLGIARDTVVVVTSDNGAVVETPDTGQSVSTNGALRGGKAMLYEGGLRVPLLVRWPSVVEAGSETGLVTGTTDWYPTLLEIAGIGEESAEGSARDHARDNALPGAALDGRSLLAVLRGETHSRERPLHFFYPHYIAGYRHDPARETWWNTPGAAVRSGSMKLIRRFDGTDELYDLAADPGETLDLAAARAGEVARLGAELDRWLESEGAHLPRPNLAYDPGAFDREIEHAVAALGRSSEWTPNGACSTTVSRGRLTLDCEDTPFIVGPEMVLRGPLRVAVRFQSSGTRGAPALWYRGVAKPQFAGDRVALEPGADAEVREGRIAVAETVRQLRLDFGRAKGGRAVVDWLRVYRDGEGEDRPLAEWSFDDGATGGTPD